MDASWIGGQAGACAFVRAVLRYIEIDPPYVVKPKSPVKGDKANAETEGSGGKGKGNDAKPKTADSKTGFGSSAPKAKAEKKVCLRARAYVCM